MKTKTDRRVIPMGSFVEDHLEKIGDVLGHCGHFKGAELGSRAGWVGSNAFVGHGVPAEHSYPCPKPRWAKEMLSLYYEDMEDNGYDVLIAGHTHHPGRIEDWYFNSGTWARKKNTFVQVSPNGDAAVFDWIDGRPSPTIPNWKCEGTPRAG